VGPWDGARPVYYNLLIYQEHELCFSNTS